MRVGVEQLDEISPSSSVVSSISTLTLVHFAGEDDFNGDNELGANEDFKFASNNWRLVRSGTLLNLPGRESLLGSGVIIFSALGLY